jgi:hypothetical protein
MSQHVHFENKPQYVDMIHKPLDKFPLTWLLLVLHLIHKGTNLHPMQSIEDRGSIYVWLCNWLHAHKVQAEHKPEHLHLLQKRYPNSGIVIVLSNCQTYEIHATL